MFSLRTEVRRHGATLLPLFVGVLTVSVLTASAWPSLQPLPTVSVAQAVFVEGQAKPTRSGGRQTVQAPGWLEAEPFFVPAAALADGVVESIDVLEGDYVEAGQIVAHLIAEDSELKLARRTADRDAAAAEVGHRKAELIAAQTDWEHPVERERAVATAAAALAEAQAALAQLPSEIRAGKALHVQLIEEREKAKRSLAVDAATELEVTIASQQAIAQAARVEALEAREPILKARVARLAAEHVAAQRNLELRIEEKLRVAAAEAHVLQYSAILAEAEASRAEAQLELERMVIRAPISGYVQRRIMVPGDKVLRGMDNPHSLHVMHIYDPERIQVRVDIPLADARHVFVGQRCEVTVEVLPQTPFEGEVLRITHEADLQKNTLQAKVKVLNPSHLLRPEMLTRVKFLPDKAPATDGEARRPSGLRIPSDALRHSAGGAEVLVVRNRRGTRGTVVSVPVEVVRESEAHAAITGDVHHGDLVVVSSDAISTGQQVKVVRG